MLSIFTIEINGICLKCDNCLLFPNMLFNLFLWINSFPTHNMCTIHGSYHVVKLIKIRFQAWFIDYICLNIWSCFNWNITVYIAIKLYDQNIHKYQTSFVYFYRSHIEEKCSVIYFSLMHRIQY